MKFKISWALGIAGVYIAFVLVRLVFIVISQQNNVDLVSDDYYDREVRYEQQIRALKNTQLLPEPVLFSVNDQQVQIVFPRYFNNHRVDGTVCFFRPSDTKLDKRFPLNLNDSLQQTLSLKDLQKGYWKLQVDWKTDTTKYYQEFPLFIQ